MNGLRRPNKIKLRQHRADKVLLTIRAQAVLIERLVWHDEDLTV